MGYAEEFWTKFQKNIADEIVKDANFMGVYKTRGKYTRKMNHKTYGIISRTIKAIDSSMEIQKEYLRVDVTAWKSALDAKADPQTDALEKDFQKCGMNPHLWNLCFAVEHENDHEDWMDEVLKLVHLRCPLKIVIGYVPFDQRDDDRQGDIARLHLAAECLEWTDAYKRQPDTYFYNGDKENGSHEEFLVILGNCWNGKNSDYDSPNYKGYLFDNEQGFQEIGA